MTLPSSIQQPRFNSVVNSAVPGMPALSRSASGVVGNLLSGMPGTSTARRASAYMGAASGAPGSEFVRNRGFDLYNQQGEQRQQQGIQGLLALLQGFSQPMLQERGQEIQRDQFSQNLGQRQSEFDRGYKLNLLDTYKKNKWNAFGGTPAKEAADQYNEPLRNFLGVQSLGGY